MPRTSKTVPNPGNGSTSTVQTPRLTNNDIKEMKERIIMNSNQPIMSSNLGGVKFTSLDNNLTEEQQRKIFQHQSICSAIHDLYITKNLDYGDSVSETYNKYGMISFIVRMEDKLNRVYSITQKGDQKVIDESLEDTLLDLANYAILAAIELRG